MKKKIKLMTKQEREKKVTNIMLELAMINMTDIIDSKTRVKMHNYMENGKDCVIDVPLTNLSKKLIIRLHNNKKKKSFLKLTAI